MTRPASMWLAFVLVAFQWSAPPAAFPDDPRLIIEAGGHTALINSLIFTRDGRQLVSAGDDKVIRIWDVQRGVLVRSIRGEIGDGAAGEIFAAALSPDNRYLAVGGLLPGGLIDAVSIRIHDFQTGDVIRLLPGHQNVILDLAFSPDGRWLASGSHDRTVRIWDVERMAAGPVLSGHTNAIYAVAFSPDGKRLASGSNDGTLRLWDVERGTLLKELTGHAGPVSAATFSPDGRYLASGSNDKTVRLWEAKTGGFVKVLGTTEAHVVRLSFSPDGHWLVTGPGAGSRQSCTVFAVPSGQVLARFDKHDDIVLGLAVSPDGQLVAAAGGTRDQIFLWDPRDGRAIHTLVGNGSKVYSVAFGQDGQAIAFGTESNFVNPNHRGPLQQVVSLRHDGVAAVTLGEAVRDESAFERASDRRGEWELTTKTGGPFGKPAILEVRKGGVVLHKIERDATSGYVHRGYTFTHDARFVASGGDTGVLTVYETATGRKVHDLVGHTGDVFAVAVSPDDTTLVSGSGDQTVRLWDVASGQNLLTLFVGTDREWVAWTPQGYYAASLKGDKYIGWHLNQGLDKAAKFYPSAQFERQFYRPDVVAEYLAVRDIKLALERANTRRGGEAARQPVVAAPNVREFLPPDVFIYEPDEDNRVVPSETLAVKARVRSPLPLTEVKVFHNGLPLTGKGGGTAARGDSHERRVELEVRLQEGRNQVRVVAVHDKAESGAERWVEYKPGPGAQGKKPDDRVKLILLAVGISDYQDPAYKLDYAADDARAVIEAFRRQEGGRIFKQVLWKQLPGQGEPADRGNIINALDWLTREGTQQDLRVVFLSGHGGLDPRSNYYFFSSEHRSGQNLELNNIRWGQLLDALTAAGGKAILIVDTCHAARVVGAPTRRGQVNLDDVLRQITNKYAGVVTFAASTGTEVSVEDAKWGHGAFTLALLEGLAGAADGYGGEKDGVVETKELGAYVIDRVKKLTEGQQHAQYLPPPDLPPFPLMILKERP